VHDITITKFSDKASPQLFLACAKGNHIPQAILTVRKAAVKPVEYLKIKLVDVMISSIQMGGGGNSIPADAVSLDFLTATLTVYPVLASGALGTPVSATIENSEQGQAEPPPAPPA
jgi:type VI secretion system secreted protein Hcp